MRLLVEVALPPPPVAPEGTRRPALGGMLGRQLRCGEGGARLHGSGSLGCWCRASLIKTKLYLISSFSFPPYFHYFDSNNVDPERKVMPAIRHRAAVSCLSPPQQPLSTLLPVSSDVYILVCISR